MTLPGSTSTTALFAEGGAGTLRLLVYLALALVLMVLDHRGGYLSEVRRLAGFAAEPLYWVAATPGRLVGAARKSVADRSELTAQNAELRERLMVTTAQLGRLQAVQRENQRLRQLLDGAEAQRLDVQLVGIANVDLDPFRHRVLLDLYCGTGSIGITLADHAEEVVGIEVVADAVENARVNAAANGVSARYRVAKVEDVLDELAGGPGVAAVVDPPRVGLHPDVARALANAPLEVLVYVACNPASLGRDREVLEAGGWVLERCWAVDLFPQTGHLEVVARFTRPA